MKLKPNQAILITLLIFAIGISISIALGFWNTQTEKTPIRFLSGENMGNYDPSDIRGSYTFGDLSLLFEIPVKDLGNAYGVTENIETFQCKSLEKMYEGSPVEIGTGSVRLFVSAYKGWEIDPNNAAVLEVGRDIITKNGKPTLSQVEYLNSHFILSEAPKETPPAKPEPASGNGSGLGDGTGDGNSNRLIKGKTSFSEAISFGIPQEKIESIIGGPINDMSMTIRSYCNENGLEFSVISQEIAQ